MGCGEGNAPCQQVRMLDTRYESLTDCTAATEAALTRYMDTDFPVVVAQCTAAGASNMLGADSVRLPDPETTPLFQRR
jgi:hypothetical protein